MKYPDSQKPRTHTAIQPSVEAVPSGYDGFALTPPSYGIDALDGESSAHAPIQRRTAAPTAANGAVEAPPANRTGLPDPLKAGIETLSGLPLDDVRVHYNSSRPAQLQALAYTQGTNIHIGPGQERHLPHEAWHVVQQKQGRVRATMQMKGAAINDDSGLEREADVMGSKALYSRSSYTKHTPVSYHAAPFPPVLQPKWIDDRTGKYYEWDTDLDGLQWYASKADPNMMFFSIVDPQQARHDLGQLQGPEHLRSRAGWVTFFGGDPHAHLDPSMILIPTPKELGAMKERNESLPASIPGGGKTVYVLSQQRQDIQELLQYAPSNFMTEYIFDYQQNVFATGERAQAWVTSERHPYIAKQAGLTNYNYNSRDLPLAGGMLKVFNDQIFTNESSGHYGDNWTPQIREQFKRHVRRLFPNKPITHSTDYLFNG